MLATAASMSVASPAFAGTHTVRRGETLSAVAKAVTGSHWNGHLFFGLTESRKDKRQ